PSTTLFRSGFAAPEAWAAPQEPGPPAPPAGPAPPVDNSKPSASKQTFDFVKKLFTAKPASFLVQGIVPGGGTGGGGHYVNDFGRDPWERNSAPPASLR